MSEFPKTLLLTRWSPAARYAGGEYMRKILSGLPVERIIWAHMGENSDLSPVPGMPISRAFTPVRMHWRFKDTSLDLFRKHCWAAGAAAQSIAKWMKEEGVELLWVASDLHAISAGLSLVKKAPVRVHVTVFDAFEVCRLFHVPRLYYSFYRRTLTSFLKRVQSFDAISDELIHHLEKSCPFLRRLPRAVLPSPAMDGMTFAPARGDAYWGGDIRRIGFCGAPRFSADQWTRFLSLLKRLPWKFEIHSFASELPDVGTMPNNVRILKLPYVETETSVIQYFIRHQIDACYLGLWKEPRYALFAETSLSSKLTTYLSAGIPVIADMPENSAAWKLVGKYEAGIRLTDQDEVDQFSMERLLGDRTFHRFTSDRAHCLCREHFLLAANVRKLEAVLKGNAQEDQNHGQ